MNSHPQYKLTSAARILAAVVPLFLCITSWQAHASDEEREKRQARAEKCVQPYPEDSAPGPANRNHEGPDICRCRGERDRSCRNQERRLDESTSTAR